MSPEKHKRIIQAYDALKTHEAKRAMLKLFLENPEFDAPKYDETYTRTKRNVARKGGKWIPEQELKTILKGQFKTAMKEGWYHRRVITLANGSKSPSGALEYRKKIETDFDEDIGEKTRRVSRNKEASEEDIANVPRLPVGPGAIMLDTPAGPKPKAGAKPKP